MLSCEDCGTSFGREANLRRHKNHHCKGGERDEACEPKRGRIRKTYRGTNLGIEISTFGDKIPTFGGDLFYGNKPLTRQTLYRMMKMMRIPEDRWDRIATAEQLEWRKRNDIS